MKFVSLLAIFVLVIASSIEARSYARRRPIIKPIVKSQICPEPGCPLIFIEPGCRRETYYYHNGVQCRGCPENICNQWQGGLGQWQDGFGQWEDGIDGGFNRWGGLRNNWQGRRNRQNRQFW